MDFDEDPNYLDLDDILAQTQLVECTFTMDIPGLEFIVPGHREATQGTDLMLPFWMARTLYTYSMIDIEIPNAYNQNFREILQADAVMANLHKAGPHYYRFGELLLGAKRERGNNLDPFTEDGQRNKYRREEGETIGERGAIASSLLRTFQKRSDKLLDYSINASLTNESYHNVGKFIERLDNLEKRLFQIGRQQVNELDKWKSRKIELIANNQIAVRLNKRRKLHSSLQEVG